MFNRTALFALALTLPLAACADEAADDVDAVVVDEETVDTGANMVEPDPMMADTTMDAAAGTPTAQSTLDAANAAGGLTAIAPATAVSNIDGWIAQLEGNADAAGVVDGLRTLRGQLQATPLDGAAIGATLSSLGEQTTAVAGGDAGLEQLGSALSSAGSELQGM